MAYIDSSCEKLLFGEKKNERRDKDMKTPMLMSSFLLQWRGAGPPSISFPTHISS